MMQVFMLHIESPSVLSPKGSLVQAGTPGRTRTCNHWIRSPLLYPIELRAHIVFKYTYIDNLCQLLSAFAEDHGLCPWMNAKWIPSEALAKEGYPYCFGGFRRTIGTTGFTRGAQ